MTGVGFLGAGMIWRHRNSVVGLATAATVWLVAALGMGIGLGQYFMVAAAAALILTVLWAVPRWQQLARARQSFTYEVTCPSDKPRHDEILDLLQRNGLQITRATLAKEGGKLMYIWTANGRSESHMATMSALLDDPDIHDFHVS